jgi:hypothetical protein
MFFCICSFAGSSLCQVCTHSGLYSYILEICIVQHIFSSSIVNSRRSKQLVFKTLQAGLYHLINVNI